MAVVALQDGYQGEVLDQEENFHGNRVVYLHWEDHLMFCAAIAFPLPPGMPFGGLLEEIIPTYYGAHPDFKNIDWAKVRWTLDGEEITPEPDQSLEDLGVRHKSMIRFWTPGLKGYRGTST